MAWLPPASARGGAAAQGTSRSASRRSARFPLGLGRLFLLRLRLLRASGWPRRLDLLLERRLPRDSQVGLEELVRLLADPLHQHQVFRRLEGAVLLAEVHNPLRHARPHPGQQRELLGVRRVDVDYPPPLRGEAGERGEGDEEGCENPESGDAMRAIHVSLPFISVICVGSNQSGPRAGPGPLPWVACPSGLSAPPPPLQLLTSPGEIKRRANLARLRKSLISNDLAVSAGARARRPCPASETRSPRGARVEPGRDWFSGVCQEPRTMSWTFAGEGFPVQ